MTTPWTPSPTDSPFDRIGGEATIRALVEAFYEEMYRSEPALTKTHETEPDGRVKKERRDRFALFLIGWLGGPKYYVEQHGHPRLRMRHATVRIESTLRDAWVRCMVKAMRDQGIPQEVREFLEPRFAEVADFLRNVPDTPAAPQ